LFPSNFWHLTWFFLYLLLSKIKKMKIFKSCFYSNWKCWKNPKHEHFIEIWSWGTTTTFLNGVIENFFYIMMFYTIMYFYREVFRILKACFVFNMNFLHVFFKYSRWFKISTKNLKFYHVTDFWFHILKF